MSTLLSTAQHAATTVATLPVHDGRWDGPGPWWPIFPFLWLLVIIGLIVSFRVFGMRRWRRFHAADGVRAGEARLAERFAAGEIDEQEYESRRAVLRRGQQP